MGFITKTHQNRPNLETVGFGLENIAHARGGIGIGKDQHIRGALHFVVGENASAQFGVQGRIDVHFTLIGEIQIHRVQQGNGRTQAVAGIALQVAKLRMGAHRDVWRQSKAPNMAGRTNDRFGDLCW